MGPFPITDGHDLPGLFDELVPGFATERDDVVVGFEDPVGEPVVADELPDVLDGIEFRGSRRQRQERDVGWDRQLVGGVPAGLIKQDDAMGARRDL